MTRNKKGFTIIEVVLVLAIAGLIFIMVFIALPALNRNQRNVQRQQDVERFIALVNSYKTSNQGKTPFDSGDNMEKYVKHYISEKCELVSKGANYASFEKCGKEFTDPDGDTYGIINKTNWVRNDGVITDFGDPFGKGADGGTVNHYMLIFQGYHCGSEDSLVKASGANDFAVMYIMSGGSHYCVANY